MIIEGLGVQSAEMVDLDSSDDSSLVEVTLGTSTVIKYSIFLIALTIIM